MSAHFLLYWKYENVLPHYDEPQRPVRYSASAQYKRVEPGDELWFVSSPPGSDRLYLVAHLIVGWRGSREEAIQILDLDPGEIWDAPFAVIAREGTAEGRQLIDITAHIMSLLFEGGRDRLDLSSPLGQQLQAMRRLSPESADLLRGIWYGSLNR